MPVVTQFSPEVRLPFQCPLHPLRDVYGQLELAKLHYRVNLWTCSQCGKSFSGERSWSLTSTAATRGWQTGRTSLSAWLTGATSSAVTSSRTEQ